MKKDWVLTQDKFDTLLDWLDADRDRAGRKYESIRLRLIKIFTCRGCHEAEELADETINRVIARVAELASGYEGDPALYFYGVSQKVHLEYLRSRHSVPLSDAANESISSHYKYEEPLVEKNDNVERLDCLERCLDVLSPEDRQFFFRYYQRRKVSGVDVRKLLATELGVSLPSLRMRAHRVGLVLGQCIQECLKEHVV